MILTSKTSACAFALALALSLVGLYVLGSLGRTEARAQPASRVAAAPSPPFVYGPGSSGFGYYNYSAPGTTPAVAAARGPTTRSLTVPARGRSRSSSSRGRDWSTGRRMTLAKPWLRPMD
jgi:hypothetical protein